MDSLFYHIVSMVVKIELEVRMAVKIVRVLNTNAVVSSDQEGRELDHNRSRNRVQEKRRVKIWMKHWRIKLIIWRVSMTAGDCRK